MSHDLLAELAGYQSELANAERYGRAERAAAVRAEADRVRAAIAQRVEILTAEAESHVESGQDVLAAQAMTEARRLARALETEAAAGPLGARDAADRTPRQTATTRKKGNS